MVMLKIEILLTFYLIDFLVKSYVCFLFMQAQDSLTSHLDDIIIKYSWLYSVDRAEHRSLAMDIF